MSRILATECTDSMCNAGTPSLMSDKYAQGYTWMFCCHKGMPVDVRLLKLEPLFE
uniref:Uncharacterized protein n=1 Tax=Anguilla anguilla TaxID=7936 RepID=A0A0E9QTX6_ANGAN